VRGEREKGKRIDFEKKRKGGEGGEGWDVRHLAGGALGGRVDGYDYD